MKCACGGETQAAIARFFYVALLLMQLSPVLAGTRIWDGGGTNNNWTTATNWVGDVAPVPGDDLVFPAGAARLGPANNFPAGTSFSSIALSGADYFLTGSNLVLAAGISATHASGVNHVFFPIQLSGNQTFTNAGPGVLTFSSQSIDLNGHDLTLAIGGGEAQFVFSPILGSGSVIKTGVGVVYLGFGATNTYTGVTEVRGGTLYAQSASALGATNGNTTVFAGAILDASGTFTCDEALVLAGTLHIGSAGSGTNIWTGPMTLMGTNAVVELSSGARADFNGVLSGSGGLTRIGVGTLVLNATNSYTGITTNFASGALVINGYQPQTPLVLAGGTLAGTGTVGNVTVATTLAKTLSPGSSAGILTCSNLSLITALPPMTFAVELNGTAPGSGYDQVLVNGSVGLSNVNLSVNLGFTPAIGDSFVIINNDGTESVIGNFLSLNEGRILNIAGRAFEITYTGGTGNDVVLTRISSPTQFQSAMVSNGQIQLQATGGLAGFSYPIEAATNLTPPIQWSNIGSATASGGGVISFIDTNAPLLPMRFYRVVSP